MLKLLILITLMTKGPSLLIPSAYPLHIGLIADPDISAKAPYIAQGICSPFYILKLESPKLLN